jgi:hypothetical protein
MMCSVVNRRVRELGINVQEEEEKKKEKIQTWTPTKVLECNDVIILVHYIVGICI